MVEDATVQWRKEDKPSTEQTFDLFCTFFLLFVIMVQGKHELCDIKLFLVIKCMNTRKMDMDRIVRKDIQNGGVTDGAV